jgi:exopolysaccharide production protein ExoZ
VARRDDKTLAGLQIMRAVAAMMVAAHHAMEAAGAHAAEPMSPDWLITAGAAGVDIFFVISGFIMMVVAFPPGGPADRPWSFLRKRIARIYPLYWATALAVVLIWAMGVVTIVPNPGISVENLVRSLLLAPTGDLLIPISWTLVHEMNFYLLFAIMLFFGNRAISLIGVAALIVLQIALAPLAPDAAFALFLGRPIALEFAFGMALGYVHLRRTLKPMHWAIPATAFALLLLAPLALPHESTGGLDALDRVWAWGLPAVLIVAASVTWRIGADVCSKAGLLMGDASYAIYLLHPYVVWLYVKGLAYFDPFAQAPQLLPVVVVTILSGAAGVVAHLLVERPVTDAARRLLVPKRGPAVAHGPRRPALHP